MARRKTGTQPDSSTNQNSPAPHIWVIGIATHLPLSVIERSDESGFRIRHFMREAHCGVLQGIRLISSEESETAL